VLFQPGYRKFFDPKITGLKAYKLRVSGLKNVQGSRLPGVGFGESRGGTRRRFDGVPSCVILQQAASR